MESTLNLQKTEHFAEAADYLGWGRDSTGWDSTQQEELKRLVQSAQRRFYFGAMPEGAAEVYGWTFLKPVATVQLVTGSAVAPLPDDFGGFEGLATVSLASGSAGGYWPLDQRHEEQLRVLYAAAPTISGRPIYYAEKALRGLSTQETQKSQLYVYPLPDAAYVVAVAYFLLPDYLTASRPFPYGGAAHAETMKAAVRAAAELFLDNRPGPEEANYRQCLVASISYDRRHQPKVLGVNTDPSDWLLHRRRWAGWPDGMWHPLGIGSIGTASYGV